MRSFGGGKPSWSKSAGSATCCTPLTAANSARKSGREFGFLRRPGNVDHRAAAFRNDPYVFLPTFGGQQGIRMDHFVVGLEAVIGDDEDVGAISRRYRRFA